MTEKTDSLVVSVADLLRRPGTQRRADIDADMAGLRVLSAVVPADQPVEVRLVLEAIGDSVTATGAVLAPWTGECRRCLRPVTGVAVAEVREVFEPRPVEGETYPLTGDQIDLGPLVRDAVLLALPLAPLCDAGCAGPDPEGHPVTVEGEGGNGERAVDPRWSALDQLRFD